MGLVEQFRAAEQRLGAECGIAATERWVDIKQLRTQVRLLEAGEGQPVIYLNGIAAPGMGLAPLVRQLPGHRHVVVDLPGHGLSPPYDWSVGTVRDQAVQVLVALLDALALAEASFVANSLGGMFTLWLALDAPARVRSAALLGEPAIALPGARGDAILGAMAAPVLGRLMQACMRLPSPRAGIRAGFARTMGAAAVAHASDDLLDLYALSLRLPGRAASFRSLLRRLNRGRQPRPENVLTDAELRRIDTPLLFVWGDRDVFLSPEHGQVSVDKIPGARLEVMPGGHSPWLDDAKRCSQLVRSIIAT